MANSYKQPPIKNKKIHNQIYSLQLEPLINKHLRWATVATFLDDNFGVFHCFYPAVSNHFVFIPTINHCLYYTTQNMRNMNTVNLKNAFFKGFSFTVKGANHFTCAGWVILLKKKILETVHISEKNILHKSTVQTNNHAHTGVQSPG